MRSASSWPLPLVVRLNSRLAVVAAVVITANTRASIAAGSSIADFLLREAGGSDSCGARRANNTPQTIEASPGTTKAARQPIHLTRKPVTMAATAMPRLPASPLTPIVAPGFSACCTSIGMPTGW